MKKLWDALCDCRQKPMLFLLSLCVIAAACGLLVWFPLHFWMFKTIDWMICFAGYPAAIMWFWAALFVMQRE